MDAETFTKIKEKYQHILDGKAGRWFDSGEFEYLVMEFFKEKVPLLLEEVERKLTS